MSIFDTRPPFLPFVTGSHAYGTPRPDSDVDLVVLVSAGDLALLCAQHCRR